ncbi:hypothetical protein MPH_06807 [Macrophomina phaseolina MS6]|uniref:Uncharacterized protein n=1 Tax=Macrophomina phaseolina (strain MS6) TaxID=1126212 RepID=K2R199_MACPH|nr:hypothetical protein MPH_06807 [Macrophomina phaseolina MS6]
MAALRLLRPLSVGLTASAVLAAPLLARPRSFRLHCDDSASTSSVSPRDWSFSQYSRDARAPVVRNGRANPRIWRQISSGSIIGLVGGLAVSTFSKPLALLVGLLVLGTQVGSNCYTVNETWDEVDPTRHYQFLESRGIHIVPYKTIQKYAKSIDVRSALQDNVAFKLAFGSTFALAAFAEF